MFFLKGLPGGSDGKESVCNAGDLGSGSLGGEDPLEKGMATLQGSCVDSSMDRVVWWAAVHRDRKDSDTSEQ